MRRNTFNLVAWWLSVVCAACAGSGDPVAPTGVRLGLSTEPPATAAIGVVLSPQPAVQILDANGGAVTSRGVLITASIANGGGSFAGTTEIRTDLNGRAVFTDLALVGPVGSRTLRFSAQGLAAVISQAIEAGPGPVTSALALAGNNQTAPAGTVLPIAPSVRVEDGSNNPIAGVQVDFVITGGGGSIQGGSQVTNAQGVATLGQWVLGTSIGPNSLSASVAGLSTPITFSATAVIGPATEIIRVEGDGQTGTIGGAVLIAPTVKVTDGFGNVITGLGVNFVPADPSSIVTGNPAITDANGVARLGSWRLGLTRGSQILNATRQGATSVSFTATAVDLPVSVITAGVSHSCAVDASGSARCWGANAQGQLGNGTGAGDSIPVFVTNGAGFTQIIAGSHSCALTSTGTARCWGPNSNGQLGDGTTATRSIPVPVFGGISFSQLSAGVVHTCGIRAVDGKAFCWGAGGNGRLGVGGTGSRPSPTEVIGGHSYSAISAGVAHTCGLQNDGVLFCWGQNTEGRLGDNSIIERHEPTPVESTTTFTAVAAGGGHSCALDAAGAAWCWGVNSSGQLGDGTLAPRLVPTAVQGGRTYSLITTGTAHTCALGSDGLVWCWGENSSGGRVGDGTLIDRVVPTAIFGGLTYTHLRAGDQHTCARSTQGSALCWGANTTGQLGNGTLVTSTRPAGVKQP